MHIQQQTLITIADCLNQGARNYSVFLQTYRIPRSGETSSSQLICDAFGKSSVMVGEFQQVTAADVISELRGSLTYVGDSGVGPAPAALQAPVFQEAISGLTSQINATAQGSITIERFTLPEWHPAYPVFWDFAFLFTSPTEATVLIGSSSD